MLKNKGYNTCIVCNRNEPYGDSRHYSHTMPSTVDMVGEKLGRVREEAEACMLRIEPDEMFMLGKMAAHAKRCHARRQGALPMSWQAACLEEHA